MEFSAVERQNVVSAMAGKNILVYGDVCIDEFRHGNATRLSPEAPVPVVELRKTERKVGMAGNVATNLLALGARVHLITEIGDDEAGLDVKRLLLMAGARFTYVINEDRVTPVKERIMVSGHHLVRVDRENRIPMAQGNSRGLVDRIVREMSEYDAIIVQDHGKGCVNSAVIARLSSLKRASAPVVVDPFRGADATVAYPGADVLIPNAQELERLTRDGAVGLARLTQASVVVKRGPDGMVVFDSIAGTSTELEARKRAVSDVTGAGDTAVAFLALALATGIGLTRAAWCANEAAGISVEKPGTAFVTPAEFVAGRSLPDPERPVLRSPSAS